MKKLRLFLSILILVFLYNKNVYAYNFPSDFDYVSAVNGMFNNMESFSSPNYWIQTTPYGGSDPEYIGLFTRNFNFNTNVYSFGIGDSTNGFDIIAISSSSFQSRRYDMDGNANVSNPNQSPNNTILNSVLISGSTTNINTDFRYMCVQSGLDVNYGKTAISASNYYSGNWVTNVPLYATWDDFFNTLYNSNYDVPVFPDPTHDPFFYLKVTSPLNTQNIEYTLTWDTNGSWAEPQNEYAIKYYVSKVTNDSTGDFFNDWTNKKPINSSDQYPTPLNNTCATFTLKDLRDMYLFGGGFLDHNFYIYIQIVNSDNGNPVNNKWFAFQVSKMYEITAYFGQTESNGIVGEATYYTTRDPETGITDYTDGRPTGDNTNENGERNSNGSSVSPTASNQGINNYTPTNSEQNGINYGTSLNNLSSNLSGLVQSVGGLPNMVAQLLTFLPSWVITIMAVSLGMLVIIGTIKYIAR